MKMENEIAATHPGVVRDLAVAPGDAVTNGQVLCVVTAGE
jgi:biotin carboxyl carrier protein